MIRTMNLKTRRAILNNIRNQYQASSNNSIGPKGSIYKVNLNELGDELNKTVISGHNIGHLKNVSTG
jgi:hypothetical protein